MEIWWEIMQADWWVKRLENLTVDEMAYELVV